MAVCYKFLVVSYFLFTKRFILSLRMRGQMKSEQYHQPELNNNTNDNEDDDVQNNPLNVCLSVVCINK